MPNGIAIFRRGPPYRVRRVQGGMENDDYRPISRFISELMQDRAIVTTEGDYIGNRTKAFEWHQ